MRKRIRNRPGTERQFFMIPLLVRDSDESFCVLSDVSAYFHCSRDVVFVNHKNANCHLRIKSGTDSFDFRVWSTAPLWDTLRRDCLSCQLSPAMMHLEINKEMEKEV
jgi:hypothetical protein